MHISCIAGTSSLVGCLLVVILLQILAAPAFAGHYTVVYSGGVASTPGNSYPYTTGSYGWGGSASYSGIGAFADASGQITATFIWVEDYAGEVPPLSAVVYETCTSRSASYYGINTADDGFGDTSSSSYYSTQCSGTRGSVKSNPGTSFSITCSPSAHASGSMYGLMASVQYGAAASVVFVGLSGTLIGVPGNNILIGQ